MVRDVIRYWVTLSPPKRVQGEGANAAPVANRPPHPDPLPGGEREMGAESC
jgi:hypothetical protein